MEYAEDDFLMISGIQHFSFCPRQWALIHIDQVWAENVKTMEGNIIHENCHNPDFVEKRGELLVSRGMRISIMGPLSRPRSKILRVAVSRIILSSEASKVKLVGNLVA